MKRRIVSIVFALCLCLALLPSTALAAEPATETADFTASDGGAAAIALLNAAKWDNAENSTWDSATKTLTLKGVNFQTTAGTAVKLPAGSIIVLADRTHNNIYGGDAEANETGGYQVKISVYGIYAEGALTIQGAGGLNVRSGKHTNTGNAWTYSTALYAKGLVTVEGGKVELTGGETKNGDCAFSTGLELPEGSGLSVTGGEVTAKGGESTNTEDGKANSSFSRGIDAYGASVSVSGSGKLTGDAADKHGGLSWGVYISGGDLTVSDSANVFAHVHTGIEVSSGNLIQTGGRIDAGTVAGGYYGLLVERNPYDVGKTVGNATVSGGTLDVSLGEIYFSVYGAAENQGNFTVSGEGTTVYAKSIDGVRTLAITDATMRSGSISAEKLTLQSGSLTVTESVREYNSKLYANPALSLQDLTINGGTLNVSWYWGENTPIVFPVDDETGFPTPLVKIWGDGREATFNGGVSTFDTGCAGNIALKLGKLSLGENMVETGAANTNTDAHTQAKTGTPVVFSAFEPYPVRIVFFDAAHKTYDGTTAVTLYGTLDGVADGDDVTLDVSNMTAAFADANVGIGKTVNASGTVTLRGKDAYKYYIFQQPVLENITANITPRTEFTDATNKNQTIYVGGDSFEVPRFTGIGGETIEGSLAYNLIEATEKDIPGMLRALKAGDSLYIPYTFTADGNYSGERTGTITVTAQERPSYGGGGSHTSGYPVTVPGQTEHGSVTVNPKSACKGDTVTITVKPDSGYVLETLTAMDKSGSERKLTDKGGGKYTFTMPAGKVEVKATFMEDNSVLNFFYDVPNDSFYYEAVKWAAGKNIASGVGNNLFAPDQPCTRAQIVTFLWRAAGSPEPENSGSFSDVPASAYYAKAVAWAVENGITTGTGDGMFSPDAVCTRAQAVTFLWRYEKAPVASRSNPFTDVAADSYYADAVLWAVKEDITKGTTDTTFSPGADCTRAQIVTFLWRCKK
mgnify:FL=1